MFFPNEKLLVAIQNGHLDEVLHCIRKGFFATSLFSDGRTAIGTAAAIGESEILDLLIQSCEEPNLELFQRNFSNAIDIELDTTPEGMDKLEWEDEFNGDSLASDDNDKDSVEHISLYIYYAKTFERTGAIIHSIAQPSKLALQDPHTADALLMTPLHYAAAYGQINCIRILLAHGARVDVVNSDGCCALHLAVEFADIVHILLENGANPNIKTITSGESVLHLAIRSRCSVVAKILIQYGANINAIDYIDQTPLICAVLNNMHDIASKLLDHGARVNLLDRDEKNAIYYAVLQNNISLVSRLLQRGARICPSYYMLHHCVSSNMVMMAELLVTANSDCLSVRNKEGITPIMLAILSKKIDILESFLKVDATTLTRHEFLMSVQHINTLSEFRPIARILLTYAQEHIISPLMLEPIYDFFSCCLSFCQMPLSRAIMLQKLDIASFLLKEGVDARQICSHHVMKSLRVTLPPGCCEFFELLVHAGFKYPNPYLNFIASHPANCSDEEKRFENTMRKLFEKPLILQSLTRLAIRRHLMKSLTNSIQLRKIYVTTNHESSLSRMVRKLEIPKTLRLYVANFDDCLMPTLLQK